jgi:eukaryotic-like serine/threonine-protein kinase
MGTQLERRSTKEAVLEVGVSQSSQVCMPSGDLEFLMNSELLRATPDNVKKQLLSSMEVFNATAGERFISQGSVGDRLFLIQKGTCIASLESNGQSHPVARLRVGQIVGEMAVLTGEPQTISVDAETDMTLWALGQEEFEEICEEAPILREFITEIATERLCSQRITAERTIGRYLINEVIAEGGWSIVYKGYHSFLNLPVAIKMLKHNMAIDSELFDKFQNEAKIIAALNHENIVRVYDIEHVYRTVFIIMEHLDGVTLRTILEKGLRIPLSRMLRILTQICAGLEYAHEKGIVHQDVKPGNIFVQKDDLVKIVDFGLACPIGGCSNDLPGTAYYMAPEQIEGEPVDARTDVYALGITAFEMATGQRPFPDDVCEVLKAHITAQTPDPRVLNPSLPEGFSEFIRKATEKDPAKRYSGLGEVRNALFRIARDMGLDVAPRPRRKRRVMSLVMLYEDEAQIEINRLIEGFGEQLEKTGAQLRIADLGDI